MPNMELKNQLLQKLIDSKLSNEIGGVIYSGDETLDKGKYLFLGLNPGGEGGHTIRQDFENKHVKCNRADYNHMLDGCWGNHPAGESLYQLRFKFLFNELDYSPRKVCATNLVFLQSPNESLLREKGNIWNIADSFWPFHKALIEMINPDTVFIIYRKGLDYLRKKLSKKGPLDWNQEWRCGSVIGELSGRERLIVYLPHFSGGRPPYAPGQHPIEKYSPEIFDWIRKREASI